jgi:hypothetical protein
MSRDSAAPGEPHRFEGRVESLEWGGSRYTIIRVPAELADDARAAGTRRVGGHIDDVRVNAALTRAPVVDGPFLWAGSGLLRRLRVEPGEPVECVLAPVDPDQVDLPADVEQALHDAGAMDAWDALRPASRRRRLQSVESARRADTRTRRIADLVAGVHDPA